MLNRLLLGLLLLAVQVGLTGAHQPPLTPPAHKTPELSQAQPELEALIGASGAEVVAVAVYDLKSRQSLLLNERVSLHAASTMKVPVLLELYRQAAAGKFRLTDTLIVKNEFRSIVDGSPYHLEEKSDSDAELYKLLGTPVTYRKLAERMIVRSSNLATNILIEKVGAPQIMELMRQLKATEIQVRRGVEDNKAFAQGLNNTTTAYDLMLLLRALAAHEVVSPAACQEMIEILMAQEFNRGIPAGLPPEVKVAHKTGNITRISHDAAIVYPPARPPYVLVVLTKGIADQAQSSQLIASIARVVHRSILQL